LKLAGGSTAPLKGRAVHTSACASYCNNRTSFEGCLEGFQREGIIMLKELPIIVHKQFISFSWGIKGLNMLKKVAVKNGFTPIILLDENDICQLCGFSHVFVMGVDKSWIESVLERLAQKGMTGIIICSDVEDTPSHSFIIHANQASVIKQSVEHLLQNNKSKLALFGVQKNDVSDASKVASFCEVTREMGLSANEGDIYMYDDDITRCFHMLCSNISRYDAVICANDIVGVYFLKECKSVGIKVPEDLFVTGNGNTWMGSHVYPSLTTFDGGTDEKSIFSELFIQQYKILCAYPQIE
jgi:DNA-binding LacI/PurR family transcriptional regulator